MRGGLREFGKWQPFHLAENSTRRPRRFRGRALSRSSASQVTSAICAS